MTFTFTVAGAPVGWHTATPFRDRRTGKLRFVSPSAMCAYKERVRLIARTARPRGWRTDARSYSVQLTIAQRAALPDLTDVQKLIEDALRGIAYVDDRRVDSMVVDRLRSPDARECVSVTVEVLA